MREEIEFSIRKQKFHSEPAFADISEPQVADDALRQSEERFPGHFKPGLLGMAVSSGNWQWTEVDDRLCEITGFARDELLGRRIADFVHPDDVAALTRSYSELMAGRIGQYAAQRRYLRKNGTIAYLNVFVIRSRFKDGTADCTLALFEDVTGQMRTEAELRQSRDELRAIYDRMEDGIVIVDLETAFPQRANAAICRMLGYSEEEMKTVVSGMVHPPDALSVCREHYEAVCRDGFARTDDLPFVRKDGKVIYADTISSKILYDGRCCRISFVHDITARKLAEESLRKEHRTLQHLLQSSDHERQTIAYDIHDGLAQYLAGCIMRFQSYMHLKDAQPELAQNAFDAGMALLQQSHSGARRLIAGIRSPVLDEAGVVEAVENLINDQNRHAGPKITFHSAVKFGRLVPILENAIYRICQEGLSNACKHSQSADVLVTLLQQRKRLRIEIRDWGVGMNPNEVREGHYGLTGIRERARLLGGKYRIQSGPGRGTRIVVTLPIMAAMPDSGENSPRAGRRGSK